ncbi:MAG: ATP-dependent zinc protease [Pseudomonadota bacterium]
MATKKAPLAVFGWREWVELPELGLRHIKAKVDTGARTSSLHAFNIESVEENGRQRVVFDIHPVQNDAEQVVRCTAEVVDMRRVKNSGGQQTRRWVIETPIRVGDLQWTTEITLAARDDMKFRMLIGRTAMHGVATVDPSRSYVASGKRWVRGKA